MIFTGAAFAVFFALVYPLWLLTRRREAVATGLLLLASLMFYGYGRPWIVAVMAACAGVDWAVARLLPRARRPRRLLAAGIGFNLGLLAICKYAPLLLDAAIAAGPAPPPAVLARLAGHWVVPLGVSFYSFSGIAYMVDVYRRETAPEPCLLRYALFASFFPHLVAGPILRAREFLIELRPGHLPRDPRAPTEALVLLGRGYFRKLVLADGIGAAIDPFFANVAGPSTAGVWALPYVYLYAFQIYFDFAGYTDIARGLGLLFGFRWPENFARPYLAGSVRVFWRRWHMTLSRFLRDYLYLPLRGLGASRWHVHACLLATMALGGIWHGASLSFAIWGLLHGGFLVVHRVWSETALAARLGRATGIAGRIWHAGCVALTFNAVCLGWCFFRLTAIGDSLACLRKSVAFDGGRLLAGGAADPSLWLPLGLYAVVALAARWRFGAVSTEQAVARLVAAGPWTQGAAIGAALGGFLLALILAAGGDAPPFLYFQF